MWGGGITLEKLIKRSQIKNAVGVELSSERVKICHQNGIPDIQGNCHIWPLKYESVDVCIFLEVIEHLDKPKEAIMEIHRILKANGKLIIMFPNDRNFRIARMLTMKFKEMQSDNKHIQQWTPSKINEFLKRCGFNITKELGLPMNEWQLCLHYLVVAQKIA
jgi:SAM-dependent methyltransferase